MSDLYEEEVIAPNYGELLLAALNPANNPFIPQPTRGMAPTNPATLLEIGEINA